MTERTGAARSARVADAVGKSPAFTGATRAALVSACLGWMFDSRTELHLGERDHRDPGLDAAPSYFLPDFGLGNGRIGLCLPPQSDRSLSGGRFRERPLLLAN